MEEAAEAKWSCPACGRTVPVYDHTKEQQWRHLDTCHCQTYVHARLPRVQCPEHGVRQVAASWASPGSHFTLRMETRLIDTLKECDVTGVTRLTGTSWDEAWRIVEKAVARGLARKPRRIPPYFCVDEKSFAKRHRYETVICDGEQGTVEYVIEDRRQESLEQYYRQFTVEELAVDKVRRQEHKALLVRGDERLKGTKHLWLANQENVPEWRRAEFEAVRGTNLKTGRAWAIKESLRKFWTYRYAQRAADYFRRWYFWATHSRLTAVVNAAKTLHAHLRNILTYFRHRLTNATAEGLNSKIQMVKGNGLRFSQSRTLQDGDLLSLRRTGSLPETRSGVLMTSRPNHNISWSPTQNPEAAKKEGIDERSVPGAPLDRLAEQQILTSRRNSARFTSR
jgi:transposase